MIDYFIKFKKNIFIWFSSGISVRNGRCTEEETQRIRKNVSDFQVLTGITSATQLFFPERFKEQTAHTKKLRVQHRFFERIGMKTVLFSAFPQA